MHTMMMRTKITTIAILAALPLLAPAARADKPCQSTWQKLGPQWDQFGPAVKKLLADKMCGESPEEIQKCLETWDRAETQSREYIARYDETVGKNSKWTIGPRVLLMDHALEGELHTERVFTGAPLLGDRLTVKVRGTGGKSKSPYTVTVCGVDQSGDVKVLGTMELDSNDETQSKTFDDVLGLIPIVHLERNRAGVNSNKYTLTANTSEAEFITKAKARRKGTGTTRPRGE